jgi:hypothetical protein
MLQGSIIKKERLKIRFYKNSLKEFIKKKTTLKKTFFFLALAQPYLLV